MSGTVSRLYTAQIRLDKNSTVVGKTLADATLRVGEGLKVETVQRGTGRIHQSAARRRAQGRRPAHHQ